MQHNKNRGQVRSTHSLLSTLTDQVRTEFTDARIFSGILKPSHHHQHTLSTTNDMKKSKLMAPTLSASLKAKRVMSAQLSKAHMITPSYELINQRYMNILEEEPQFKFDDEEPSKKAYNRFIQQSCLKAKHEQLIQQLRSTGQECINHLNLNFFAVEHLGKQELISQRDPHIAYTLFQCLWELDEEVISKLFPEDTKEYYSLLADEIGKPIKSYSTPLERFRLEYLSKTITILSEPMTQIVRKVSILDKQLGHFVESIWKFLVILLDINIQWSADRCQTFVKEQIDKFTYEMEELRKQNHFLQENLISKVKGNQMRIAVEQKKAQTAKEQYHILKSEMMELQLQYEELGKLENAKGEMHNIGVKMKELDQTIRQLDRQSIDRKQEMRKSLKDVASIFIKYNDDQKILPFKISTSLKLMNNFTAYEPHMNFQHSLISLSIRNKCIQNEEVQNYEYSLAHFFEYLQMTFKEQQFLTASQLLSSYSGCNTVMSALEQLQPDTAFYKFFSLLFGMNGIESLGLQSLSLLISFSKQMKQANDGRKSVTFTLNDDPIYVKLYEKWPPDDNSKRVIDYLLSQSEDLKAQEVQKWKERSNRWKERLMEVGIFYNWIEVTNDYLDEKLVEQYFILRYSTEFKNYILNEDHKKLLRDEEYKLKLKKFYEETLNQVKQLYLENPRLFIKIEIVASPVINYDSKQKIFTVNTGKRKQSMKIPESFQKSSKKG